MCSKVLSPKTLDKYSLMIVSRFLKTRHDFLNLLSTSKKVETMSENFHYNPVSVTNKNLFPHIETQHLYTKNDKRIPNLYKYVIWFEVSYYQSLKEPENVVMKNIVFTRGDFDRYYELNKNRIPDPFIVPINITKIGNEAFQSSYVQTIILPTTITSLGNGAFGCCDNLRYINIPNSVKLIGTACFYGCENLGDITIPPNTAVSFRSFAFCKLLRNKIDVPKKCW
ncbi:Leucine rich repeat containing protein BspA family protein [Entamoeba marina]